MTDWYPRVVVIGPGGIKGFSVLGFLSPIEDSGLLRYTDTFCGVSIGAIISLLIVAGYEIREIVGEAANLDMFKDIDHISIQSMLDNKGFMTNLPLRRRLTQLIINKFGIIPTLHDLYMMTGKAYHAVTLNATDEKCEIMGPFTHGDISCIDATMVSMNIPFVFYQISLRGKIYVDGALGNPYPIDYFDDGNTDILGIYMKTPNQLIHDHQMELKSNKSTILQRIEENDVDKTLSIGIYMHKIIESIIEQRRTSIIQHSSSRCKHVCLESKNIDSMGFNITTEAKANLLVNGFNVGKDFLNRLRNNTYIGPHIYPKLKYEYPPYYFRGEDEQNKLSDDQNKLSDTVSILHHMSQL